MAEHTIDTELFYDAAWNALPVYHRDGISVVRGAGGEGQDAPPTSVTMTVDNRTRDYSIQNPAGALYGKVGRNTPLRVVLDGSTRATVEASSWKPDQALGDNPDAWVNLDAGGILRRLQQGKTPLLGPLHRAILADSPAAFWTMAEGSAGTQFSSGLPDGNPIPLLGTIELGEVPGPAGAASSSFPDAGVGGYGVADLPALTPTEWGFEALLYLAVEDEATADGSLALLQWDANGDVGRDGWGIGIGYDEDPGSSGYWITILGNGFASSVGFGLGAFELARGWHHIRVQAEQVGGNVELTLWVDGVIPSGSSDVGTDTAVGTLGGPRDLVVMGDTLTTIDDLPIPGTASVGMLAFYSGTVPDHAEAAAGYVGELAGVRFLRVAGEEGVPAIVVGDELDTQPMGAQPAETLLTVLRECVRTDDGILFEPADQVALAMRTGRSRYNQTSVLDLVWTDPGIAAPLRPQFDERPTFNDVTAKRRNGGEARAVQLTGPLNVNDPIDDPDGVGRSDTTVDVNTATDGVLLSHATWHLAKGTVPDARYPQIVIDLDDAPGLTAAVNAVDIGDKITLDELPVDWAQEPVPLLVVGIRDSLPGGAGHRRRLVTLVTIPASPYEVLLAGVDAGTVDLRGMRVGTTSSTVDGAHVAADTTILIDSAGITWTTDPNDWDPTKNGGGMFLELAGEVVRVTGIAGAGSAWTLTVVRAVNGVSKTIPDGTPVRFRFPGRLGL